MNLLQELDRRAIIRYNHERGVERGDGFDDVFGDIVVAAEAPASVPTANASDGNRDCVDDDVDNIVFVDRDDDEAAWEREQISKEPQRWAALPFFVPVRTLNFFDVNRNAPKVSLSMCMRTFDCCWYCFSCMYMWKIIFFSIHSVSRASLCCERE